MEGRIHLNDGRFRYNYKGFCSILNQVIDLSQFHYETHGNLNVQIFDSQILEFFENKYHILDENSYDVGLSFLDSYYNGTIDNTYNAHTKPITEILVKKNTILNSILYIKPSINDLIKHRFNKLLGERKYLGLQLRGTDKKTEIPEVSYEKILKGVDLALTESNLNTIFLSTDDIRYVELITKEYGNDMVVLNEDNTFSTNSTPIHLGGERSEVNFEVLRDVLFLKNSYYLCYTYSNVGYLSLIMGVNNIKNFKILNNI